MGLLFLLFSVPITVPLDFNVIESLYDPDQYVVLGLGSFVNDTISIRSPFGGRTTVKKIFVDSVLLDTAKKYELIGETNIGLANRLSFCFIGDWDSTDVLYQFIPILSDTILLSDWDTLKHFNNSGSSWEEWIVLSDTLFAPHIKLKICPHLDTTVVLRLRLCEDYR